MWNRTDKSKEQVGSLLNQSLHTAANEAIEQTLSSSRESIQTKKDSLSPAIEESKLSDKLMKELKNTRQELS